MKEEIKRDEHGRFIRQGTPGPGRPAEAPNKVTRDAKKIFNMIMDGEIPCIKKALAQLKKEDPYKYLTVLTRLMSFHWPQKLDVEVFNPYQDLSHLSYEELYQLKYGRKPKPLDADGPLQETIEREAFGDN